MVVQLQSTLSSDWMDPVDAARQQRIARYKEERRRQLAAQYGRPQDTASGSSSGGGVTIRSTRASRLRSAAAASTTSSNEGTRGAVSPRLTNGERKERDLSGRLGPESPREVSESSSSPGSRDKSSKRKSNLNRSLNAEPVPPPPNVTITANEDVRGRRTVPSPGVNQSPKTSRPASARDPDSESPRSTTARDHKRTTPPRETTSRPRPRSSSALLERQNSAALSAPTAEPTPTPPTTNGICSTSSEEPTSLPDVILSSRPSSILKKKSVDETPSQLSTSAAKPVSILKRKTSQEEGSVNGAMQPVTFSPSVVEPAAGSLRRQGILKKHRSLDDGRRSVSPPSSMRRASLEELCRRANSPEPQSILKRKTSREEGVDSSGSSEPQGILKRKTSSGSPGPVHFTIAESVIMALAGEDSLADETVKPILKKKTSMSEETQDTVTNGADTPRPILKKKSSSETDDGEDKPKRPILKSRNNSVTRVSESRSSFTDHETSESHINEQPNSQNGSEERKAPSALSARAESSSPERSGVIRRTKNINASDVLLKRRSFDSWVKFKEEKRESPRYRASFSVAERVTNMENFLALEVLRPRSLSPGESEEGKGAVPKRGRNTDRWRTQPITVQELSASRTWSREAAAEEMPQGHALSRSDSVSARASLFEAQLKQQKEEEVHPKRALKGSAGRRVKLDPSRFQTQPVTQDEVQEAKRASDSAKTSTDGEEEDPSKLSLAERVRLFNQKMVTERLAVRPRQDRHKTQPVTPLEVQTAQKLTPIARSTSSVVVSGILKNLTEKNEGPKAKNKAKASSESDEDIISEPSSPLKRGILKSQSWRAPKSDRTGDGDTSNLRSVLKKENKKTASPDRRSSKDLHSILKVTKEKEGSSSEETETESEDDKPNTNSDLIDLLHKVEAQARGERKPSPECNRTPQITSYNKKPEETDKLMNLKNLDQGKENYNVTRRLRRKKADGSEVSEGDSSSSGGREVRKIISNDAVARRRQAGLAREAVDRVKRYSEGSALSKSRSHSAMNGGGDVMLRPPEVSEAAPLRRCRTQPMDECDEPKTNGVSIAQRLEALQKRGHTDWKKRISRLNPEEELPPTISINAAAQVLQERLSVSPRAPAETPDSPSHSLLEHRRELLESSTQGWKKRVNPSDATQFSVAGRMPTATPSPLHSPAQERRKKIPKPERFRSKGPSATKDVQSVPTSPEADSTPGVFKRSISAPGGDEDNSLSSGDGDVINGPLVSVPKAFDDDFSSFFVSKTSDERIELRDEDLEEVTSSTSQLLVQRRTVKVQKRRGTSANPVKALAARTDLRSEYVEVRTGVAQREEKRLKVEKLSKNCSLAVEALAGLASQEDFSAVTLRSTAESTAHLSPMLPYRELMLLHVKGRRHVQTRLVRPHYTCVNQGDSYVLVTPSQVFHWLGQYSNVIERSRGAEIAQHIARTKDLGCTAGNVTTLQGEVPHAAFWRLLGADEATATTFTGVEAGHPDEDELYELTLTDTNMVYEVEGEELVPRKDCWGTIPKIEILHHNKVLVFDFGAELYVWMGKTVTLDRRRTALRLGQELWAQGFDYTDCDVCPLTQADHLGLRSGAGDVAVEKKGEARPEWALLAKVTQHMETVLLREKFLDWPDFSRVIQVKSSHKDKQGEGGVEVKPCDAQAMVDWTPPPPDLVLEGTHLGRGSKYFDPEGHKHYEVSTISLKGWHILQYDSFELDSASQSQLHSGDTYVFRWCYSVTVTGRELTGQPSRHAVVGRDRCVYFTWQGADATTNDKGAAALLTVQLDQERSPQLRLTQGQEPPAFRHLFGGGLILHKGRRGDSNHRREGWRLYMVTGEETEEVVLVEVLCSVRQLRSHACLLLLHPHDGRGFLWRGNHTLPHSHQAASRAVEKLKEQLPAEAGLEGVNELQVQEIDEGKEPKLFFEALGGHNRQLYVASVQPTDHTPRLFHLSSASGLFQATPIVPACHHPTMPTPFPYSQHQLYSAMQPALFLLDAGNSLWLWQGWWGDEGRWEDNGVGEVRWQAERRAAMTTALEYHRLCPTAGRTSPLLVWAGLEPLTFTNLFPSWLDRDDIAELNIRDGLKPGEVLPVEEELERLTRSTYPPAQLLQRPLPQGVDPTRLEEYLAPHHFQEVLGLSKEEFSGLPSWKQNKLKQEKGLF